MEIKRLNNIPSNRGRTKQAAKDIKKMSSLVTTSGDSVLINQSCSGGSERMILPCNMPENADGNVPSQAPEEVDSTHPRSDASSDIGDLKKKNSDLVNGRMNRFQKRNSRDRLKQMVRENCPNRKLKTESSSSNSTSVVFPASSTGTDSSTCNKLRVEEPEEKSSTWKQENLKNASGTVGNVAVSCDSQQVVSAEQMPESDDTLKSNLPKLENAVHSNHGKAESCSHLDNALEISTEHDTKSQEIGGKDRTNSTADFDLNEDVVDEAECLENLVKEIVSCSVNGVFKPKPLTAKSGKCISLPVDQLQLQDVGGWRGPAATSAFRTMSVSKSFHSIKAAITTKNDNRSKDSCAGGFDLNISAAGDDLDTNLLPEKYAPASSGFPFKGSSKHAERFKIDLNHANENEDSLHPTFQPSARMIPARDFDLNDNLTFQDTVSDAHQPVQSTPSFRNKGIDNPALSFFNTARQQEYRADPFPMQVYGQVHARPFLMAVPNIEQMQRVVPPQSVSLPYPNGFCSDPSSQFPAAVYSSGVFPYVTDQNRSTVYQNVYGTSTHPTFSGTPQFTHIPGGTISNGIAMIAPNYDPRNRNENVVQQFIPLTNHEMEEKMRSFQPIKRREPEGGWDSHQHGYRKMNSWL